MTVRKREPAARRIEALVAEDRDLLKASGKEAEEGATGWDDRPRGRGTGGNGPPGGCVAAPGIAPAG
jgi:hypothetical protein